MSLCEASLWAVKVEGTMIYPLLYEYLIFSNTEQEDLGNTVADYDAGKAEVSAIFSSHLHQC